MVLLENDPFLSELMSLLKKHRQSGSVTVTMKRSCCKPPSKRVNVSESDWVCLVRATDGKRRISTVVPPQKQVKFQDAYSTILKASMDNLKRLPEKRSTTKKETK